MIISKNFISKAGRLSAAGLVVLGGFQLGVSSYLATINVQPEKVELKSMSEQIEKNEIRDLNIKILNEKKILRSETLQSWLEPYIREYSGKEDTRVVSAKVDDYIVAIATNTNTQPVNAKFSVTDGKVQEFIPPIPGYRLDTDKSEELILKAIIKNEAEVILPVETLEPEITLAKANDLGITTLIGRGESDFRGSSQARIRNIKIGAAKYNGVIIKPDEKFSFNSLLGEVNEENGFESELVIKKGKLVKESGGGLCQVSTTLFRSAIMAGLPILERRPHSFPVRYYNPQGFDATIYPGVVDLKFKNDTSSHILIQSRVEGTKLIFDIYGSSDGGKVTIDGPHQYDQKSNGSTKAYFIRKIVSADGTTKEERFDSNYGAPAPLERNPLE